ncbi:unnamed protein product [Symbiodinium necroappetens]|uniref:Uncharacterized protein n=1 Tax=Symbiodinium necroappetens TaxID=1628268 RepID=A0A812V9G1_9DINO|nr:unnamed protein product [Symbiodinium necroappetens]
MGIRDGTWLQAFSLSHRRVRGYWPNCVRFLQLAYESLREPWEPAFWVDKALDRPAWLSFTQSWLTFKSLSPSKFYSDLCDVDLYGRCLLQVGDIFKLLPFRHVPVEPPYGTSFEVVPEAEAEIDADCLQVCSDGGCKHGCGSLAVTFLAPYAPLDDAVILQSRIEGQCTNIKAELLVSGQNAELAIFVICMAGTLGLLYHIMQTQKRLALTIHAMRITMQEIQSQQLYLQQALHSQNQDLSFYQEKLFGKMEDKFLAELYEQCQVLAQFFKPANLATAGSMMVQDIVTQVTELYTQQDGNGDGDGQQGDSQATKKQLLEVLAKLGQLQTAQAEITSIHKLLNGHSADFDKLSAIGNRVTETHGLLLQINGDVATAKVVTEQTDRLQKVLERKLEDLTEKTAVIRALMDQHRDKVISTVKDNTGWISKNVGDVLSLLRTLAPMQQKTLEMMGAGQDGSRQAQQTLLSCAEAVQTCEDRLVRLESLCTGIVDQQNEMDQSHRGAFDSILQELPTLQEVLSRLPKLPVRKPPAEKATEATSSTSSQQAHPTTPPTTLGPQPPPQVAANPTPTVIPVSIDTGLQSAAPSGGIQLRLSEHVNAVAPQPQPQFVLGGESRAPNFLITPIPAPSPTSGNDLLRAMLRQ